MLFPAVVIVPLLEILWVLFIMVSGGIYFGDFKAFNRLQLIMFGIGVFLLLLGMFCLMPQAPAAGQRMSQQKHKTGVYDAATVCLTGRVSSG